MKTAGQVGSDRQLEAADKVRTNVHVALLHYPVLNKAGETIASAVTPLDLHDISRAVRTYGARRFFVVTPLEDQQEMIRRVRDHWIKGYGATYNPARREALETVRLADTLEAVKEEVGLLHHAPPRVVITSSKAQPGSISFGAMRKMIDGGRPHLLVFGTAWGLAPEVIQQADASLQPIWGRTDYNHLSVRSAATAVLDRLLGY